MRSNLIPTLVFFFLVGSLTNISDQPTVAARENAHPNVGPGFQEQETTFSLTRLAENPTRYSLIVTEGDERSISGTFSVDQLQILKTVMAEAEKFAMNGDAVGTKEPLTTRFSDKQETAFIADVEKLGVQSKLYLTLETELGRATFEAGRIFRSTRREVGFFFDLLSRLESVLPKLPAQSPK